MDKQDASQPHAQQSKRQTRPVLVTDFPSFEPADLDRLYRELGRDHVLVVGGYDVLRSALEQHPEIDVLCTGSIPDDLPTLAPNLRWIQLPSAGADHLLRNGLPHSRLPLVITTASGVHATPITEYVFGSLLLHAWHWRRLLALQRDRTWADESERTSLRGYELFGTTIGIVGLGHIGRHVAYLARAFGMRVLGVRRTSQGDAHDPDVDALYRPEQLREMLGQCDYVVIATPSTPETHHLIGEGELRSMRPHAYLVNIARGNVIDEAALVRALTQHWIGGAGLDVVEEEPLSPSSRLWSLPNAYPSPHISGATRRYGTLLIDLLLENLHRYEASEPLLNVLDPERGY
jgi:phosphoglycerate dehydrogenase-like enzyme